MVQNEVLTGIVNVDQTADPGFWVRYLDTAGALQFTQALKRRTFELLAVKGGDHLLDVGCGPGDDVRALAQLVGSSGRVVGIDSSETMIREAQKRAEGLGLPVEYEVSDAQRLNFADKTFDGCRTERTLVHVTNPHQALAEMARVIRPGARLVALEPDFETLVLDAEDRALTRTLLNFACDRRIRNGWIGRQLPRLFTEAGLTELTVFADTLVLTDYALTIQLLNVQKIAEDAQTAGVVSTTAARTWLNRTTGDWHSA